MSEVTHISQLDLNNQYTIGDYLSWKLDEWVELIKGKIYLISPAPKNIHQTISYNIGGIFYNLLRKSECKAYHAPFDVYLSGDDTAGNTVVQPDFCVICDRTKIKENGCVGAPDLIVEILSPSTLKKDIDYKFHLYEECGVKEYWIIAPEYKQVSVYFLNDSGTYDHKGDFGHDSKLKIHIWQDVYISCEDVFEE